MTWDDVLQILKAHSYQAKLKDQLRLSIIIHFQWKTSQEEILTTNLTLQRILERIFQAESVDMHIQEDTGKIKYSRTMLSR